MCFFFFFQAEDGIRDYKVTGVQTCALPISQATRWLEASPSIIRDGHGQVVGVRAICRDVTERKELEYERDAVLVREQSARVEAEHVRLEAEEAQARAEDATRAKDQF